MSEGHDGGYEGSAVKGRGRGEAKAGGGERDLVVERHGSHPTRHAEDCTRIEDIRR
jgi:hypothetical protein